jgi:branched-chain amino acid transport system permease protein
LPAILVGGLGGGLLALILSPLLVRVSGTAFAMLTLAFGQLIFVVALKYREVTGGEDGIGGYPIPPLNIFGLASIDMTDKINFYYFALVIISLCLYILWFYTKTPFGSLVVGVRDNALRIDYLGFKLTQTKALNLIISGTFAGIAGALHALLMKLVSTVGVLDINTSFKPIMMAYIGGVGSFFGPIIGSGVLHVLEDVVIRFTERIGLVNGAIFILVVLFAPRGLVGLFSAIKEKWFHKEKI